jgi:hypothetical protein
VSKDFLIKKGKPPAMPVDSQSLTIPEKKNKNLSVNNIKGALNFTESDNSGGQMVESHESAFQLFIANQKFS